MLALAAVGICLLAGCSEWGTPPAPRSGGTLTVSLPSLPSTWAPDSANDSLSAQPIRDVEAPLLQLAPRSQKPVPGLARSWKYDGSRTHLTVTLRPKAEFSNGHRVTSQDVVFSADQWLKGPEHASFYSSLISGVDAHGKHAVVFTLTSPSSVMVDALSLTSSAVVPDDFGGRSATDFYAHPVGAGPFAIRSTSGSTVDLERNPHFYEATLPYLSHLDYRVVSDPETAQSQVSDGSTGLAEGLPASDLASGHGRARVVTTPSQSTSMLTFSPRTAPATSLQLRRAVSLAIDRSALVTKVYDGDASVARGLVPDTVPGAQGCPSCDWSAHDPSRARSELASVPHHAHLTLLVDSAAPSDVRTAQAITPMLAEAGITLHVQPVDSATLAQRVASGDYEMALRTLSAQMPSPADPLQGLVAGHYLDGAASVSAAETARRAVDTATRQSDVTSAVAKFEQQVLGAAAAVPLVDPDVIDVVSSHVHGLALLPSGLYHAAGLWLKK